MKKTKTFYVFRSTFTGITNSLLLLLLNLLSRKLFLNYIGIEYLSAAQIITNLLTVFSFTELGLASSVIYMLYEPITNDDKEKVSSIIWLYRKFNRVVGLVILLIGIVFMPLLPTFIKTSIPVSILYLIYILNLITSVSSYFYTYRSVLLSANQQDYIISLAQTAVSFTRIIIQCLIIYLTHDYILFLVTGLVATIIQNAIVYFIVGKKYPYIKALAVNKASDISDTKVELTKNISAMASVKIAGIVINNTDNILVSLIDTLAVGLISNYTTISTQLRSLVNIFHNSLLHSIGVASSEKGKDEKYKLFKEVLLVNTFIVGLISVCLGSLWKNFIIIWLGKEFTVNELIFEAIFLNFMWNLIIAPIWMFRDANGVFVYIKKMLLLNATLNILISVLLGKLIGVAGVFFATIISDVITDFWYDSKVVYENVFERNNSFEYITYITINVIINIVFTYMMRRLFKYLPVNLLFWILEAVAVALIYITLFIFMNFYKDEFRFLNNLIIVKLKKFRNR